VAAALIGWCATMMANSHFSTFGGRRLTFFRLGAMLATPSNGIDDRGGYDYCNLPLTNVAAAMGAARGPRQA